MLDRSCSVWVGCKALVREEQLHRLFASVGNVDSVKLMTDRASGQSRGFGFVNFRDHASVEAALSKMRGAALDGVPVLVRRSLPMNELREQQDRDRERDWDRDRDRDRERDRERDRPRELDRSRSGGGAAAGSGRDRSPRGERARSPRGRGGDWEERGGGGGGGGGGGRGGRDWDRHGGGGGGGGAAGGRGRPPVIRYRLAMSNLATTTTWAEVKDFLRYAGEPTYAQAPGDGTAIGEFATAEECRSAIERLEGATLDGMAVHFEPLNFDLETGRRTDADGDGRRRRDADDDRGAAPPARRRRDGSSDDGARRRRGSSDDGGGGGGSGGGADDSKRTRGD
ncbi:hypothetical protein Rsub_02456 [Raphidocelis subcapitata]|uniref:RRM domain-containing protein n=1 Tax=Raphidocelis subcapitata TaxID=307507 RepID=A0A2V0NXN8_9CHLO|nr:hypothetical protein Rsub_02456 [Raphidocelis subcapitata]|eukprot:GBF90350.1 hypothetical protein Rsub_02456 [Raphidocelis subcapitata]